MAIAHLNRIGTAVPPNDVHEDFVRFIGEIVEDRRTSLIFKRMAGRAGIEHRYSYFVPFTQHGRIVSDVDRFYVKGRFPDTAARMARFEQLAPRIALAALDALGLDGERERITHLVLASCTGFVAPGVDQSIVNAAGLSRGVERTVVGFMGCYAAVNALRLAHHFVRSDSAARVLVMNLELCTLHFQETLDLERLLAMLLFGDGCSAALVTADETGLALQDFRAATIADSSHAITWRIGNQGFDMHLSGEVPTRIQRALEAETARNDHDGLLRGARPGDYGVWAIHAGGRSILDAAQAGLDLPVDALHWSRGVLRDFGNMSSATLMFVLGRILTRVGTDVPRASRGFAVAFGPGLAAESFRFTVV